MRRARLTSAGVAALLCALAAPAAAEPAPVARARVDGPTPVPAGGRATVVLEVLVPTWFSGAPTFPVLEVPGAVVVPPGRAYNFTDSVDGQTFAGQSREYAVYPQRGGTVEVDGAAITVSWVVDGRPTEPTSVAVPATSFEVAVPPGAEALDRFLSSTGIELDERLEPRPGETTLHVGDALVRTLTVEARDTLAMLIPPLDAPAPDGVSLYADAAELDDVDDGRGGPSTARRSERLTYVFEEEGEVRLPAVEIAWWNPATERVERATADEILVTVEADPVRAPDLPLADEIVAETGASDPTRARRLARTARRALPWAMAVATLAWLGLRTGRRHGPALLSRWREARTRRATAEPALFRRLRSAARADDAAASVRAYLRWRDALGTQPLSPDLAAAVAELERHLYGPPAGDGGHAAWSGRQLLAAAEVERRSRRAAKRGDAAAPALAPLNPGRLPGCAPRHPPERREAP